MVLVAIADDFVRIDDVVQQRVERAAAHAGEIGADIRAFAVKLVADETGALRDLVAGLRRPARRSGQSSVSRR